GRLVVGYPRSVPDGPAACGSRRCASPGFRSAWNPGPAPGGTRRRHHSVHPNRGSARRGIRGNAVLRQQRGGGLRVPRPGLRGGGRHPRCREVAPVSTGRPADGRSQSGRRGGDGLGSSPGGVRGDDYLRRQRSGCDPDHAARRLPAARAGPRGGFRARRRPPGDLGDGAGGRPGLREEPMSLSVDVAVRRPGFDLEATFEVASGQVVAVAGPNGAGKTTLLRATAVLERVERGRVVVGDITVFDSSAGIDLETERRGVGMVFQGYWLFPHMTVAENVAFA